MRASGSILDILIIKDFDVGIWMIILKLREDLSINEFLNLNIYSVSFRGSCTGYIINDFIIEREVEVFNI
jgi:hypothetical protein